MAFVGNIPVNLDEGVWRARASNPDGYVKNARFCSLQIENEDGEALVTLYFARLELERVQMLAALLNTIANPVTGPDAGAPHERHNLPADSLGLPPTFPIAGPHPGDDARRGVNSPRSRPAALPAVDLVETGAGEA